jgi:hypothetical protein
MRRRDFLILGSMAFLPRVLYAVKFPEYPTKPAKEYPGAITIAGLAVGVEPLADPAAQKQYFGVNFSKNGFLPVFVVVENGSLVDSFILSRELIGLYAGDEEESKSGQAVSGRSKTGENLALASFITGSIGGLLIASHLMVKATEVKQNLIKKELRSATLSPGQMNRGFVYVPLPSDPGKLTHLRMRVRAMKVGSDQPTDFEFPI